MKALITGATGFIGSRLAESLGQAGVGVVASGQANNEVEKGRMKRLIDMGVPVAEFDVGNPGDLSEHLSGVDTVFHLAAAQHEMNVPDEHFWRVNVEGTRLLLESCVDANVGRFVHGSTIGVYGDADIADMDESTATNPDNIYGVTKLAGERLVLEHADKIPVTVIRISETYGPGDRRLLKLFRAVQSGKFLLVGPCDNVHQPIYVDDLVTLMRRAAESPAAAGEVFVAPGAEKVTTRQMAQAVADALGVARAGIRVPMAPLLAAAVILEKGLRPLGIQPPLHTRRLDFFRKSLSFSPEKMKRVLDFVPTVDFRRGAELTARWYRDEGLL